MLSKKVCRVSTVIPAIAIALLATGCAQNPAASSALNSSDQSAALTAFTSGTWKLQSLTRADATTATISELGQFTIELSGDNRVALRVDCNRGSGSYTVAGGVLTIGPLALTKAYCSSASLDNEFLSLLGGETTIATSGESLQLSSSRGALLFVR